MLSNDVEALVHSPSLDERIQAAAQDEFRRQKRAALRTLKLMAVGELWRDVTSRDAISDTASNLAKALLAIISSSWAPNPVITFIDVLTNPAERSLPPEKSARTIALTRIRRFEHTNHAWTRIGDIYPAIDWSQDVYATLDWTLGNPGDELDEDAYDAQTHLRFRSQQRELDTEALHEFAVAVWVLTVPDLIGDTSNLTATIAYLHALRDPNIQ